MTVEQMTALETARNNFIYEAEEEPSTAYTRIATAYKTYLIDNGMPETIAEVKSDEEALKVVLAFNNSNSSNIDLTDTNKLLSLLVATN